MKGYNIVVFGKKGFGKTTWIRRYLYENPEPVYLIYDHFNEYDDGQIFGSIDEFTIWPDFNFDKNKKFIFRGEIPFDDFFGLAYDLQNCVAVFDEIDLACSPHNTEPNLYKILNYGRHKQVGIISASRRPANVSRNLTSQSDEIISFRIAEPRDLKYIEDFCGSDMSKLLPNLGIGEFCRYPHDFESDIIQPQENAGNKEIAQ